jgi:hypothetical protein
VIGAEATDLRCGYGEVRELTLPIGGKKTSGKEDGTPTFTDIFDKPPK